MTASDGVLLLDKPEGCSSFAAVRVARSVFGVKKVGHTGTLDPFATGLLVVGVGRGTSAIPWLEGGRKTYLAQIRLGAETDTLDPLGTVCARAEVPSLHQEDVQQLMAGFVGQTQQRPPAYSAIKVDGRRAYARARAGEDLRLAPRQVELYSAEVLELAADTVRIRVVVGPGFYVRSFARDVALGLGTVGHLETLRRTTNAGFTVDDAVTLDSLRSVQPALIPLAAALDRLPAYVASPEEIERVKDGVAPAGVCPGPEPDVDVRVLDEAGCLLAIARFDRPEPRLVRVFSSRADV